MEGFLTSVFSFFVGLKSSSVELLTSSPVHVSLVVLGGFSSARPHTHCCSTAIDLTRDGWKLRSRDSIVKRRLLGLDLDLDVTQAYFALLRVNVRV